MTPEKTKRLAELAGQYQFLSHVSQDTELVTLLLEERAERRPVAVKERLPTESEGDQVLAHVNSEHNGSEWVLRNWAHIANRPMVYDFWLRIPPVEETP